MKPNFVFIVGCNRTGTSLLRQILNKSAQVCVAPETHFLRRLCRTYANQTRNRFGDLSQEHNVRKLVAYLYANHAFKVSYWQWLKRNVPQKEFTQRVLATDRSERALFELMMRVYAERTKPNAPTNLILGEKTPTHLYSVPMLLQWFPHAQIVHTMRDPRAIIVSKLRKVNRNTSRAGFLKRLGHAPQRVLSPIANPFEVMHTSTTWMNAARLHKEYARDYPNNYRLLRFEDLVGDTQAALARIFAFLDIEFSPVLLDEIQVVASSFQAWHRGANGIDQSSLERWKQHSHPLINMGFAMLGRAQLEQFGYAP